MHLSFESCNVLAVNFVMGRTSSNRRTAEVLRKTIAQLEADPTINPQDVSFVNLKCALLARSLELEQATAQAESVIHLVDSTEPMASSEAPQEDDESAIA